MGTPVAMKAETTRRPLLPACARTLRMKCTRHLCQVAVKTIDRQEAIDPISEGDGASRRRRRRQRPRALVGVRDHQLSAIKGQEAFDPIGEAGAASRPRRAGPRRASWRRKSVQKVSASEAPIVMPSTIEGQQAFDPISGRDAVRRPRRAPAVRVDPDGDDHGDGDDPAVLANLHIGRIDPQVGPVAFNPTVEKLADALVDVLAEPRYLAFGDASHPHERPGGLSSDLRRRQGQEALEGL